MKRQRNLQQWRGPRKQLPNCGFGNALKLGLSARPDIDVLCHGRRGDATP